MPPALEGNTLARFYDALRFSETNRQRAADIASRRLVGTAQRLRKLHRSQDLPPPSDLEIEVANDVAVGQDGRWKLAVSNEQWGARLAAMYGVAVVVEQNEQIISQNRAIIVLLGQLRDALVPVKPGPTPGPDS